MGTAVADKPYSNVEVITVTSISGSQLRPYGPHVHESFIEVRDGNGDPGWRSKYEDQMKVIAKLLVHNWYERDEFERDIDYHFAPHLTAFEQVEPGRWHVIVEVAFTD